MADHPHFHQHHPRRSTASSRNDDGEREPEQLQDRMMDDDTTTTRLHRTRRGGAPRLGPLAQLPLPPPLPLRRQTRSSSLVASAAPAATAGDGRPAGVASDARTTRRRAEASVAELAVSTTADEPALVTALRPSKKARPTLSVSQEEGRRSYNLRASTVAQSALSSTSSTLLRAAEATQQPEDRTTRAAIITPRTPAVPRQLDFVGAASAASTTTTAASDTAPPTKGCEPDETTAPASVVPPGVVNIYHRQQLQPPSTRQSCNCPSNRCVAIDTSLGFSHIANYGEEHGEILMEAEARQVEKIHRLLPGSSHDADTNSEFGSDDEDDEDDDASSVEDDAGVGSRMAAGRASRSLGSAHSNRRLNLQETFGVAAAGGGEGGGAIVRERPHPAARNDASEAMIRQPYLSPKMRSILIHWLVEVGQEYKVSDAAFHLSVSLLDHLLLRGPTQAELDERDENDDARDGPWFLVNRSDFQAVGCTCAWIASKLEDKNAPSVEDFVWIADYSFTCNRLRALEEQVCRELEFRLSCVTPYHFVNLFLRASNACPNGSCEFDHPVLRQVVMYLLALSRLSYHLSLCKPSLLAAAAVYLARATVGIRESDPSHSVHPEGYWTRTLQYYTSYKREDLRGAVLIIHRYQLVAETAENIKGLFTKFSKSSHHFASLKTAVRVEDLGFETRITHDHMEFQAIAEEPI